MPTAAVRSLDSINRVVQAFCSEGVPYKSVSEIAKICRGQVMSKDFLRDNAGEYPVYSSQTENDGMLGKITTYMFDGEYLTWTTDGANAGTVFYRKGKFSVTNVCGVIDVTDETISTKYLFYVLNREAPQYVNKGMGNPKLMSNVMAKIRIPLPPLAVQQEIVRILDSFTELTTELNKKLTAELTARRKQYEHYRDELLTFAPEVEWKTIGEVCKLSAGGDVPKERFSKNKTEEYTVPILSNGIGENALYGFTDIAKIKAPCVTVAARGTIGYCELRNEDFYPVVRLICACPKEELLPAYLKYYLEIIKFQVPTSGIPQLTVPMLSKYKIPIPTLAEQGRIVAILDKFSAICNDLTSGLPAEIAARQKQYEYYRDKLLTFGEKEN